MTVMTGRTLGRHSAPRHPVPSTTPSLTTWRSVALSTCVYLALAVLANLHTWSHGIGHTIQTAGGSDVQEEIWFLAQTPWALVHGVNPFVNNWLNAPTGINLMDNTTMPLLGLLGAPITFLFGPIATFNVLLDLALCLSAEAFFLAARRLVSWSPAAFVGGLLYGFSPYSVAEGAGHLFLVFAPIPPLVVLFIDRFIREPKATPTRTGVALGLCFLAQLYVSAEVLSSLAVMTAIGLLVAAAMWWRRWHVDVGRWLRMGAVAATVCVVGAGYPMWVALAGPQHINGPAQTEQALAGLATDPVSLVTPTLNQHFTFGHAALGDSLVAERDVHWSVVYDAVIENGTYVGILLILFLVVGIALLRRVRPIRMYSITALAALVLSMGSHLHIDGHRTPIRLPFIVLAHIPLLDSSIAVRYMLFFWLCAGFIVAISVDRVYIWFAGTGMSRSALIGGIALMNGIVLFPLLPQWPYSAQSSQVPTWFTRSSSSFPVGSTLVVYPLASASNSSAMLWQAMASVRFKMPGGYAVFRSTSGSATFASAASPLQQVLALCSMGDRISEPVAAVRTELAAWHASGVLVNPQAAGAVCATGLFEAALGHPVHEGGMLIWHVTGLAGTTPG